MTFSRILQTPVSLLAHKGVRPGSTEPVLQLNVGQSYTQLSPEDANGLANYILGHFPNAEEDSSE